jgi:hypothetical protein
MGYIQHDAVLVTVSGYATRGELMPDVDTFRASMPDQFARLVVGPIPAVVNGDVTYLFAPDGSKEGWSTSDDGDAWRARFAALFAFTYEDGSGPFDVVHISYGGDYRYESEHPTAHYVVTDAGAAALEEDA